MYESTDHAYRLRSFPDHW